MRSSGPTAGAPRAGETLRRLALLGVAVATTALTITAAFQILTAVFATPELVPGLRCRPGLQALLGAVTRAHSQASTTVAGERESLAIFRRELAPEWDQAAAVRARCEQDGDKQALQAYRTLELLRYAEERAVRFEALDLAAFRKQAPKLTAALVETPADAASP